MDAAEQGPGVETEPTADSFGSTVTILFSDIRGFTEYTDAHGDEPAYRMLQHHNGIVRDTINLYGGHVVKTQGESFMVSFESARTALVCAVAIQRTLGEANENASGPRVEIGIGVNTGEPIRDAGDFFGGMVNLAARICAVAGHSEILISDTTRMIAGKWDGLDYVDRGTFELKGFHEPQHLYEVDWSGEAAQRHPSPVAVRPQAAAPAPRFQPGSALSTVAPAPASRSRRALLLGGGVLVAAAAVGGGLWTQFGGARGTATPPPMKPGDRLFADNRQGINSGQFNNVSYAVPWEFKYIGSELVGRLKGPYPTGMGGMVGAGASTIDQVKGDFLMDARTVVSQSPSAARVGIGYTAGQNDLLVFFVTPESGQYLFGYSAQGGAWQTLRSGRSDAIMRGGSENRLRIEVRGNRMAALVNAVAVDSITHELLVRHPGHAVVRAAMTAEPAEGDVAVRFLEVMLMTL